MILNKLSIITSSLLLSTSLFAGFDSMNPLQSSSHDTTNQSKNKDVAISWNQATANSGDTLAGYYYILDTSSDTLIPNVVSTRKTLGSSAISKTETVTGADGSYYFHLAPYAEGGNTGATLHFGPIKIDSTAPSALSISPDGGSYSETQSVSMSATDANNYTIYYTTDGTTPTSSSSTYSSAISVASSKTIKAIAIDSARNESSIKSSAFTLNTTTNVAQFGSEVTAGTTIATSSDGNSASVTREITVSGSSVTHYKYKVDSASFSAQTTKETAIDISSLSDGSHTISIIGYDGSTWQTDASATTLSFTVDNTAPSAIAFSRDTGTTLTENTTLTITSTNSDNIYYTTDGSTPTISSTNSATVALTGTAGSTVSYTIKAIAFDTAGNKTSVSQAIYNVEIPAASSGGGSSTPPAEETTEEEVAEEVPTQEEVAEEVPTEEEVAEEVPTQEEVAEEVPTQEEVAEEVPTEEEVAEEEVAEEEVAEEVPTQEEVAEEVPTEEEVAEEVPTQEVSVDTVETGLTKEETIKVTNTDGTLTETTKFIDESGESVEVEVQTKLS
ncbi:MAG: chitobiase/beta-hexosaminidase C-terminal domain-containing protein, partial [Campylobacterota bacterium]|nr:chitobiase/beta-hexosaminidase C-terminal domain-containing protein [Campylobacterota bacterium]